MGKIEIRSHQEGPGENGTRVDIVKDLGWGMAKIEETAWGQNHEEALERAAEKYYEKKLNE